MGNRWILVDGYSVLHAWPKLRRRPGQRLERQREALVRILRQYADHTGHRVTLVFDGYAAKRKPEAVPATPGLEILFSDKGKTADEVIERFVGQAAQPERILVVTSDSMERRTVETLGAISVAAEVFEGDVEEALRHLAQEVRRHGPRGRIAPVHRAFGKL